jgi:drug/metabolite transporter (DMT)-like permease
MTPTSQAERRSRWLLVLLVVIWGASWPVIKIGVTTVPPIWFACLRYIAGTVCLLAVVALRGELKFPPPADWKLVVVSGILQMATYSALTAVALTRLPAGRASVLAFSTPLWVVPLSVWRLHEQVRWPGRIGVGAGLVGVLVIASPSLQRTVHDQLAPYTLLMCAAAGWAVSIVFVRAHRFQASALALAPWQTLVAALLLLPFAFAVDGTLPPMNVRGVASLAYVGPIATAFAYWAVVEVGRYVRATTMSMALLAVPGLGLLTSALTFHEAVNVSLGLGIVLIAAGVLLTTTGGVPLQRAMKVDREDPDPPSNGRILKESQPPRPYPGPTMRQATSSRIIERVE